MAQKKKSELARFGDTAIMTIASIVSLFCGINIITFGLGIKMPFESMMLIATGITICLYSLSFTLTTTVSMGVVLGLRERQEELEEKGNSTQGAPTGTPGRANAVSPEE